MAPIELRLAEMLRRLLHPGRAAQQRFLMMNLAELDPLPLGPGWFDSSWELEHGLEVNEDVAWTPRCSGALKMRCWRPRWRACVPPRRVR